MVPWLESLRIRFCEQTTLCSPQEYNSPPSMYMLVQYYSWGAAMEDSPGKQLYVVARPTSSSTVRASSYTLGGL